MARLIQLISSQKSKEFILKDELRIGRTPSHNVYLKSPRVSRDHARIIKRNGSFFFQDLGSTNGSYINGRRVQEKVLEDGDEIIIGDTRFFFQADQISTPYSDVELDKLLSNIKSILTVTENEANLFLENLHQLEKNIRSIALRFGSGLKSGSSPLMFKQELLELSANVKSILPRAENMGKSFRIQSIMAKTAQVLSSVFSIDKLFQLTIDILFPITKAQRCAVVRIEENEKAKDGEVKPELVKFSRLLPVDKSEFPRIDFDFVRETVESRKSRIKEVGSYGERKHLAFCLPVKAQQKIYAVVYLDVLTPEKDFFDREFFLVNSIVSQVSTSVENILLYHKSRLQDRMLRDLELAREIQYELLPKEPPKMPGYDFASSLAFAKTVGGDYYDFVFLDKKRLALVLADVAGKGVPAALISSIIRGYVRSFLEKTDSPAGVFSLLNEVLCRKTSEDNFVTMLLGILDAGKHTLTYSRAGHEPGLFLDTNASNPVNLLVKGGLPLGLFEEASFEEETVPIAPGNKILYYTDGVTDVIDRNGKMYGRKNLCELFSRMSQCSSEEIIGKIFDEINRFSTGGKQNDDRTMIAVSRL